MRLVAKNTEFRADCLLSVGKYQCWQVIYLACGKESCSSRLWTVGS